MNESFKSQRVIENLKKDLRGKNKCVIDNQPAIKQPFDIVKENETLKFIKNESSLNATKAYKEGRKILFNSL